jgi:Holliday junction DNA helicase RuvA
VIATLTGILAERSGDTVVVATDGGVGYEVVLPLGVMERLPAVGRRCALYTELVVREDGWTLYGFDRAPDRAIFQRLLTASGFGPRLALALLSTLGPERAVRCIQNKDIAALATVPGIGRKKAERLVVELSDRFGDVVVEPGAAPRGSAAEDAARALTNLGYQPAQADDAVRAALAGGPADDVSGLIKRALQILTSAKGGRT